MPRHPILPNKLKYDPYDGRFRDFKVIGGVPIPKRERVFLEYNAQGLGYKQIAHLMGRTYGTTKEVAHKVRKRLQDNGVDFSNKSPRIVMATWYKQHALNEA